MDPSEGPGTLIWVPGPLSLAGEVIIFIQLLMTNAHDLVIIGTTVHRPHER